MGMLFDHGLTVVFVRMDAIECVPKFAPFFEKEIDKAIGFFMFKLSATESPLKLGL